MYFVHTRKGTTLHQRIKFANHRNCSTFAVPNRGRVEIGRQARLRIWCRKAYGFDSLRPHSKKAQLYSWAFFVGTSAEHAVEGNLRFLNPCHFVTSPFWGTPTTPDGRVGRHLGSMFCVHLARECRGAEAPFPKLPVRQETAFFCRTGLGFEVRGRNLASGAPYIREYMEHRS